jgi:hypothetical protein
MANETCAYYSSKIVREYLERDYDDDVGSDRRSEVVAQNEQFAPYTVEDATGRVPVNGEGAEVDARQVVDRFERNTGGNGPSISLGGATINLGGGERTLGYRYAENILTVDAQVYMLGTVQEDGTIGGRHPSRRDTASSSVTAPRMRSARASARRYGGSASEASARSWWESRSSLSDSSC